MYIGCYLMICVWVSTLTELAAPSWTKQTRSAATSKHRKPCLLDPERRPVLGSAILLPPKKCSRSLSRKINDHWSPAQATRAADHCFPPVPMSSTILITHFSESSGCPSAQPQPSLKDGCLCLFCFVQRGVLMFAYWYFLLWILWWSKQCENARWEGADDHCSLLLFTAHWVIS